MTPAISRRSWLGLIVVLVLVVHGVGIWLLMAGLARKAPNADPKASEVVLIRMVKPAPAPALSPPLSAEPVRPLPPPLKTRVDRALQAEIAEPAQPQVAPEPAPALMAPAVRPLAPAWMSSPVSAAATVASGPSAAPIPESASAPPGQGATDAIAVICPTQVQPKVPRRAVLENISGVVRARAVIRGGLVQEVTIVSGPSVYHAAVRAAMLQYRCVSSGDAQAVAEQVFTFRIE